MWPYLEFQFGERQFLRNGFMAFKWIWINLNERNFYDKIVFRWTGRPLGRDMNWTHSMTASSFDQRSCTCRPSSIGSTRRRRTDPTPPPECRRRHWQDRRRRRARRAPTRRRPTSWGRRRRKARTRARKWRAGAATITSSNIRDEFIQTFLFRIKIGAKKKVPASKVRTYKVVRMPIL